MKKLSGIILASGLSRRFGTDKLLYRINGRYIISYIIESVNNSNLNEKIIVVNNRDRYKNIVPETFKIIVNNDYLNGMACSIINGIKNIHNSDAAMIIPGDMPLISSSIINELIAYFNENNYGIVGLIGEGIIKSPVIFSRAYFSELLNLSGDSGGKSVIKKHLNDFHGIDVDKNILRDVDYIDDIKFIEDALNKKH